MFKQFMKYLLILLVILGCTKSPEQKETETQMVGHYAYLLTPLPAMRDSTRWDSLAKATIDAHYQYIKELYIQKKAVMLGRSALPYHDSLSFSICVLKTYEPGEAQAIAYSDPAVASGLMTVKVVPFFLVKR